MVTKGKQPSSARGTRTSGGSARNTSQRPASQRAASQRPAARSGSQRNGRRRPSAAVYRRRRLVVFISLLIVLGLVTAGAVAIASSLTGKAGPATQATNSPQPQDSQTAAPGVSGTASPSAKATPVCDLNLVTVAASTDAGSYAAGKNPVLGMKVTNGGSTPCQVNVGTSQMEFQVTSGADRIFSSRDCQATSEDLVKTILPGKSETANFVWQRNRTTEGCSVVNAKPGAGTYVFTASLGNKVSPKAVFQLR
ncbi:hypothetical protein [Arthrobacter cupressi]|uniref:hypothetical protein n=1 Tax=Arthrobacter cupressi TaxID=1045773 RepID=UPI0009459655|nr:hypothetical protein [Arthrobacter cupressi]NYD78214.1 hypothetical protein [Arthrobacter cupressi]